MDSRSTSPVPDGFTLLEVALTTGLVAALAGFGMLAGGGAYEDASFRSERDTLVAALRAARARAVSGVGGAIHGLHFSARCGAAPCYVLFDGDSYAADAPGNVEIDAPPALSVAWPADDPLFHAPDGSSAAAAITLSSGRRMTRVTVDEEGRIDHD